MNAQRKYDITTFAVLGIACLFSVATTPLSAEPHGDKRIKSIRTLTIPGEVGPSKVSRAILLDDTFYIAGTSWTKESGESLWLSRVDRAGKTLWDKRIPIPETKTRSLEVIALLPLEPSNVTPAKSLGIKLIASRNNQPVAMPVTPEGEFGDELLFDELHGLTGAIALPKDDMLLFGTGPRPKEQQPGVWVAHVSAPGTIVWKEFYPLGTAADQVREVPRGSSRKAFLMAATLLEDKTIAIIGLAGAYSEFGTGPSNVYLLRIQPTGEQLGQAVIKEAVLFFTSNEIIARCDKGLLVAYASIVKLLSNAAEVLPDYEARVARYDLDMKQVWEKSSLGTSLLASATIAGPTPFISVVSDMRKDALLIRGLRDNGDEAFQAEVLDLAGNVRPVQTLRDRTSAFILCNYMPTRTATDKNPDRAKALLIEVDTQPTTSIR